MDWAKLQQKQKEREAVNTLPSEVEARGRRTRWEFQLWNPDGKSRFVGTREAALKAVSLGFVFLEAPRVAQTTHQTPEKIHPPVDSWGNPLNGEEGD